VAGHDDGFATELFDLGGGGLQAGGVAGGDVRDRTALAQLDGDALSDPLAGTGDEGDDTIEWSVHGRSPWAGGQYLVGWNGPSGTVHEQGLSQCCGRMESKKPNLPERKEPSPHCATSTRPRFCIAWLSPRLLRLFPALAAARAKR